LVADRKAERNRTNPGVAGHPAEPGSGPLSPVRRMCDSDWLRGRLVNQMFSRQIVAYGVVGISNTLITVACIAVLTLMHVNLFIANAIGYAVGLTNSFLLNQRFTFKVKGAPWAFLASFGISYLLNLAALVALEPLGSISTLIPQAAGVALYTVTFFVLMKVWVYRPQSDRDETA
jgi:putative flippase GtrA